MGAAGKDTRFGYGRLCQIGAPLPPGSHADVDDHAHHHADTDVHYDAHHSARTRRGRSTCR